MSSSCLLVTCHSSKAHGDQPRFSAPADKSSLHLDARETLGLAAQKHPAVSPARWVPEPEAHPGRQRVLQAHISLKLRPPFPAALGRTRTDRAAGSVSRPWPSMICSRRRSISARSAGTCSDHSLYPTKASNDELVASLTYVRGIARRTWHLSRQGKDFCLLNGPVAEGNSD